MHVEKRVMFSHLAFLCELNLNIQRKYLYQLFENKCCQVKPDSIFFGDIQSLKVVYTEWAAT